MGERELLRQVGLRSCGDSRGHQKKKGTKKEHLSADWESSTTIHLTPLPTGSGGQTVGVEVSFV